MFLILSIVLHKQLVKEIGQSFCGLELSFLWIWIGTLWFVSASLGIFPLSIFCSVISREILEIFPEVSLEIRNGFRPGQQQKYVIFLWNLNSLSFYKLYSSRFLDLKFSLCFSASSLMVINSFLPFCLDEFLENVSANSSVIVFFISYYGVIF